MSGNMIRPTLFFFLKISVIHPTLFFFLKIAEAIQDHLWFHIKNIKEIINKWDFIKIKSFCMAKENSIQMKREPTVWENIFANGISDNGLLSKVYK